MKKLLSVLLMVAVLASLSAVAFAGPSPSQDVSGGGVPAGKKPAIKDVQIVAEDSINLDEECDAVVGTDGLEDADEETQNAVNALDEQKDDAADALTPKNIGDAIPYTQLKNADGKTAVCTNPEEIWCKNGEYPCKVKYTVDYPVETVLLYSDGKWSVPTDLEIVDNGDGTWTVSFTLYAPALYTNVRFK